MLDNWRQYEIGAYVLWLMINDKWHDSIAKRLSCDGFHCKFIIQFAGEKKIKIGEHLAKLQAKWLVV